MVMVRLACVHQQVLPVKAELITSGTAANETQPAVWTDSFAGCFFFPSCNDSLIATLAKH